MALAYLRTGLEQPDTEALRSALLELTGDEGIPLSGRQDRRGSPSKSGR